DARFRAIGLALCGLANWYFDGWRTTRGSSTIADAKHDNCTAMGRANHHYVCRGGLDSAPTNADARDDAGRVGKCRMQHAEGRIWEEDLLPFSAARWYCFCTRNWLMATAGRCGFRKNAGNGKSAFSPRRSSRESGQSISARSFKMWQPGAFAMCR